MNLKAWLDAERGRYTELAKHLDVTVGRISQMADDGVPPKFMLQVRAFTDGVVTLEEMVQARTPEAPAAAIPKPAERPTANAKRSTLTLPHCESKPNVHSESKTAR